MWYLLGVCPPNHKLCQSNKQTFRILYIRRIAVVVLEYLESTCVRDAEKLEVRVEFREGVQDGRAAQSPTMLSLLRLIDDQRQRRREWKLAIKALQATDVLVV